MWSYLTKIRFCKGLLQLSTIKHELPVSGFGERYEKTSVRSGRIFRALVSDVAQGAAADVFCETHGPITVPCSGDLRDNRQTSILGWDLLLPMGCVNMRWKNCVL